MKINHSILLILIIFSVFYLNCEHQMPTVTGTAGTIELKLNFLGEPITGEWLQKTSAQRQGIFNKMTVDVFETGEVTDCQAEVTPQLSAILKIDPETGTFEGRFDVPAGKNRLFRINLYEIPTEQTGVGDTTGTLSYSGRTSNVTIEVDKINTIVMDLYPVPIKNKRVVFWVDSARPIADNLITVSIATSDSLLGLQFDVISESNPLKIDSLRTTAFSEPFSDILFNAISTTSTRIIIFDRKPIRNVVLPICDVTAVPTPFIYLKTAVLTTGDGSRILSIQNGVVNTINYLPLEVWAVGNQNLYLP